MSFGPTATSIMQAYGLPCAYNGEKLVSSKQPREVAPVAVEANSEGVLQLDGLATRGMLMLGGPETSCRNTTITTAAAATVTLTADQLVDGVLIVGNGEATMVVTLPAVTAVNSFLNSRLVTQAAAVDAAIAVAQSSPRSIFKLTVITNQRVDFTVSATAQPGHAASGYQALNLPATATDMSVTTSIALGATRTSVITAVGSTPRVAVDVYFFQTTGTSADPEWMFLGN
jgi:hypothetical protein